MNLIKQNTSKDSNKLATIFHLLNKLKETLVRALISEKEDTIYRSHIQVLVAVDLALRSRKKNEDWKLKDT